MQGWNRAGATLRIPVEIVGYKIDETGSPIGFRQWVVYNYNIGYPLMIPDEKKRQYTIITHLLVRHSSIFHHSVHRYI